MKKLLLGRGGELVNYDYYDIAEGTGIKNFYAAQSYASGGVVQYFLTTDNTIYSDRITEKANSKASGGWSIVSDVNYDVMFNLPKTIYGIAKCSATQGVGFGGAGGTQYIMLNFGLYHYDGITSTLMASGGTVLTADIAGVKNSSTKNVPLDLTSKRWDFKVGDKLRLNIKMYEYGSSATHLIAYGCDPSDRNDVADASGAAFINDANTTQLKLQIPFILDI